MTRRTRLAALALAAPLALSACGGATEAASIDWGTKYDTSVKTRIDAAAGDCPALQREFDLAEANMASTVHRGYEYGTVDLMKYVNGLIEAAGC